MAVRERVPKSLRGPVGFASLAAMILGIATGYILTLLGITLYFDMNGLGTKITSVDSLIVIVLGLIALGVGYAGWRGFTYFAY